jgi:hypothetical protein
MKFGKKVGRGTEKERCGIYYAWPSLSTEVSFLSVPPEGWRTYIGSLGALLISISFPKFSSLKAEVP